MSETQSIVVDEWLPHSAEVVWKVLTTGDLIGRWLMAPAGFEAVEGNRFTFTTRPAGPWDGTIRCEVLEVVPRARLVYSWQSGDAGITEGYGAPLDTVVTWTLTTEVDGTRLKLVHSGFVVPRNALALNNMGEGWRKILPRVGEMSGELAGEA